MILVILVVIVIAIAIVTVIVITVIVVIIAGKLRPPTSSCMVFNKSFMTFCDGHVGLSTTLK